MVKALDLSSNGRVVRVGSNPTPGKKNSFLTTVSIFKAYVSRARCIDLFLNLFVLTRHGSNVAVYTLDC